MVKAWIQRTAQRWLGLGHWESRAMYGGENPFYQAIYDSMRSTSGVAINPDSAMRIAAVYCAVRLLSETIAQLPIQAYRRKKSGNKEWLPDYPSQITLARTPNEVQTSFEWREMMMGHVLLRGNAYSRIVAGERGATTTLIPLHPGQMKVAMLENGRLRYEYRYADGGKDEFAQDEIFHLRGLSTDGVMGISPVATMRDPLGSAKASEEYGASFFGNSARPDGFLTTDAPMKDEAARQNRKMWEEVHQGSANAHRTAVLTGGLKWNTVGLNNQDSQFLETRKFSVVEIARAFRVPPHLIYDLERATFSNIEEQSLEYVTYSILPWIRRWEERINRDLITDPTVYIKFSLEGLLRGNMQARAEFYSKLIQSGIFSLNQVLELEDMNPLPGKEGEAHWMQQQMVPIEILVEGPQKPEPAAIAAPDDTTPTEDDAVTEDEARQLREDNAKLAVEVGKLRGENEHLKDLSQRNQQEATEALAKYSEREITSAKQAVYYENVERDAATLKQRCEEQESRCAEQVSKCHDAEQRCQKSESCLREQEVTLQQVAAKFKSAETHARRIAQQALERSRRRECDTILRASKKPKEFLESVETFYASEAERLTIALEGPLALREALTGEPVYAAAAIDSYVKESKRQLLAVYDTIPEDKFASEILTVTNSWEPRSAELVAQVFGTIQEQVSE